MRRDRGRAAVTDRPRRGRVSFRGLFGLVVGHVGVGLRGRRVCVGPIRRVVFAGRVILAGNVAGGRLRLALDCLLHSGQRRPIAGQNFSHCVGVARAEHVLYLFADWYVFDHRRLEKPVEVGVVVADSEHRLDRVSRL